MNFQHLISQYGYIAVLLLMLAESACVPIPSEVIMMFGGALSAGAVAGAHPQLIGIVGAGVLGNVAGSYISWAVGKYAGQAVIRRWGRRVGIRDHEIDRANAWFERHGPVAVLLGRIVPVIRTFISLPAGFAGMPAVTFGVFTTLGCIPWTAALALAGYALGSKWQQVANAFHGPTDAIAGLLVVALAVAVILHRRRARRPAGDAGRSPATPGRAGAGFPAAPPAYDHPPSPAYREPARPGPGYPEPGSPGPGYPEPGYAGPGYPGPGYPGPGYPEPGYAGQASNPNGGWGPGDVSQPVGGGADGIGAASSPRDPASRQYR